MARAAAAADVHDNFVTSAQWMLWATQEHWSLHLFALRHGWTANVKTTTLTVTGSEAGAFPLTGISPLAIAAVHQVRANAVRPVHLNNAVDFLRQLPGATVATGDPDEYRVIWDADNDRLSLGFYPEPTAGTQFLVSYVPEPKRLTLDTIPASGYANTVSYPMGWDERIVLGLALRACDKEESDPTAIERRLQRTEGEIEAAIYDRVLAEHATVRNVDADRRGWSTQLTLPAPVSWWYR